LSVTLSSGRVIEAGDAARSAAGRRPALTGAVGRRLAREAPEVVSPDGLKPRTASQSLCRAPIYGCLLAGAYLRVADSTPLPTPA
jgi:hypothetical protein